MRVQLIVAVFFIMAMGVSCHRGNTIIISNGDDNLSIYYSGDIKFNDEETAVQQMTPDGYLRYTKNDRKLTIDCDYKGHIKYELSDDGRILNVNDEEGKKFLAFAIKDMIDAGFNAKGRLERVYKRAGNKGVLDAVDQLKNDFVKEMYLEFLLSSDSISQGEVRQVIKKTGSQIGSDFEKGNILNKVQSQYLNDSLTSHQWFESVRTIGSDFEKANALKYIARQELTHEQFSDIIDGTQSMGSDFEKSNILKELIVKGSFNDTYLDKTMEAINNISSDFEKVNLLKLLMEKVNHTSSNFDKLLEATERVGSDFDKENLIKDLIREGIPDDGNFEKLMSVINKIGGDFDRINLLKEVINKNIKSQEEWITIINAAAEIGSDFDKSNLLVAIAPNMPRSDSVKTAYSKAAKTINSEQEYGRVLKAMD